LSIVSEITRLRELRGTGEAGRGRDERGEEGRGFSREKRARVFADDLKEPVDLKRNGTRIQLCVEGG